MISQYGTFSITPVRFDYKCIFLWGFSPTARKILDNIEPDHLPKYCNDEIYYRFWRICPNCCTCLMEAAHIGVFRSRKY